MCQEEIEELQNADGVLMVTSNQITIAQRGRSTCPPVVVTGQEGKEIAEPNDYQI